MAMTLSKSSSNAETPPAQMLTAEISLYPGDTPCSGGQIWGKQSTKVNALATINPYQDQFVELILCGDDTLHIETITAIISAIKKKTREMKHHNPVGKLIRVEVPFAIGYPGFRKSDDSETRRPETILVVVTRATWSK